MSQLLKFSERLSDLMLFADNLTTDKLGEALGTSGALVRMWRLGKNVPSLENIIKLADYLVKKSLVQLLFYVQCINSSRSFIIRQKCRFSQKVTICYPLSLYVSTKKTTPSNT